MKTLMRIFVIMAVFAVTKGVAYEIVNASRAASFGREPNFGPRFDQGNLPHGDRPGFHQDGFQPNRIPRWIFAAWVIAALSLAGSLVS